MDPLTQIMVGVIILLIIIIVLSCLVLYLAGQLEKQTWYLLPLALSSLGALLWVLTS